MTLASILRDVLLQVPTSMGYDEIVLIPSHLVPMSSFAQYLVIRVRVRLATITLRFGSRSFPRHSSSPFRLE